MTLKNHCNFILVRPGEDYIKGYISISRQYCAVFKHISENGHNINFDNPTVLCSDSSKTRLFVKETLHIKDQFAHKSPNVNIKSYECKLF